MADLFMERYESPMIGDDEQPDVDWYDEMQRHQTEGLVVGARVRVVEAECARGSDKVVGRVGTLIRICRQDGRHHDPAVRPYVLDNDQGHSADHCYEVWVSGEDVTWWASAGELAPLTPTTLPRERRGSWQTC